jgi:predicted secreted hydrolase
MKNNLAVSRRNFLAAFALAKPGYHYEFPRDHFSHPAYQTEWWYYTGNLFTPNKRRFGFELTFFRQALSPDAKVDVWAANPIWLAHLALSDIASGEFHHTERINRSGPGLAGADATRGMVWNGNWRASATELRAITEDFTLDLHVNSTKPPVIHGINGVSQKAQGEGRASHYISQTRIAAQGTLRLRNEPLTLAGNVWMDHEFFTHQLEPDQTGWDWLSIQLDDQTELMLFRLRRKDGTLDPNSAGTLIDAAGQGRHLSAADFRLTPSDTWTSPATKASYPLTWRIEIPSLAIDLQATTPLRNQELVSRTPYSPTYWEGAMNFQGSRNDSSLKGTGYLEMTGYDKAVTF